MLISQILAIIYTLSGRTLNWVFIRKQAQKSKNPIALNFVLFVITIFFSGVILLITGTKGFTPVPINIAIIIVTAFFYVISNGLRFEALKHIDVSLVSIISQLSLIAGTFVPFAIGTATYNHLLGLGILLVFLGNLLIVFEKKMLSVFKLDKYVVLAIISAFALGLAGVTYDLVKNEIPLMLFFIIVGSLEVVMFMFSKQVNTENVAEEVKIHGNILLLMALFWFASGTSILVAIKVLGIVIGTIVINASLVTIVLAGIFFLGEKDRLFQKLLASVVVFFGTVLAILNK